MRVETRRAHLIAAATISVEEDKGLVYVDLGAGATTVTRTERLTPYLLLDYDNEDRLVGIEFIAGGA